MKSVGEVMAIGRSFPEALQKGIRMLNIGSSGIDEYPEKIESPVDDIRRPTDRRLFALYRFFEKGGSVEQAQELSQIDPWFLNHLKDLAAFQSQLKNQALTPPLLRRAKELGFSDQSIARIKKTGEEKIRLSNQKDCF